MKIAPYLNAKCSLAEKFFFSRHLFVDVISVHNRIMKHARAIVNVNTRIFQPCYELNLYVSARAY